MNRERAGAGREEADRDDFLDEQIARRTARNPHYPELLRAALRRREEARRPKQGEAK